MVNKLIIVNTFFIHTYHRKNTHSAIITRKTTELKTFDMWGVS